MAGCIGLIANPASGKDIRRLVAHASTIDNAEKRNILRRLVLGMGGVLDILETSEVRIIAMPDDHDLVRSALDGLPCPPEVEMLTIPCTGTALDSERAAGAMRDAGCCLIVTLGGDGTNRAVARGWREAPLIAISTGTNNVFPELVEATVAGAAAGLIAAGAVPLDAVCRTSKRIEARIEGGAGDASDLALIDAALLGGTFVGSRALWDVSAAALRTLVLARAEPAAVGLSAIGGLLDPVDAGADAGLVIEFGESGTRLRAPIAPGRFEEVGVRRVRRLALGEPVELKGPGLLALDGERERRLRDDQRAIVRVLRDGPRVVDVRAALAEGARRGAFRIAAGAVGCERGA